MKTFKQFHEELYSEDMWGDVSNYKNPRNKRFPPNPRPYRDSDFRKAKQNHDEEQRAAWSKAAEEQGTSQEQPKTSFLDALKQAMPDKADQLKARDSVEDQQTKAMKKSEKEAEERKKQPNKESPQVVDKRSKESDGRYRDNPGSWNRTGD